MIITGKANGFCVKPAVVPAQQSRWNSVPWVFQTTQATVLSAWHNTVTATTVKSNSCPCASAPLPTMQTRSKWR